MKQIEKTVFISYRRRDISWALTVYQDLTHQGYDVFFDYTSIPSGDFEQIIISNIKARAHFVLILTPTTFDRCSEPGDWLRREIEIAIDEKRNIIPLFFDDFSFGAKNVSEKLTGKLKNVSRYNGMNVHQDYFHEAMERLRTKRLNVPLDAVLHPISAEVQEVVKGEQLAANKALLQRSTEKPVAQPKTIIETPKTSSVAIPSNKITLSNGMEFMLVPAGKFIMGSDKYKDNNEKPQHTVDIPYDYWMARFPVTNELYNAYTKAKGTKHPVDVWENKKDSPIVNVTREETMHYCEWLSILLNAELPPDLVLRLPTEAEWEKAARGTDGREYPWGDKFDNKKCNSALTGFLTDKNDVTPVSMYSPQGDSPYGCADMIGNVWEWTHSLMKGYPYKINDRRESEKVNGMHVIRGGSYIMFSTNIRCSARSSYGLWSANNSIGFRMVLAPKLYTIVSTIVMKDMMNDIGF